jgi:FkbM family methyltransferase
LGALGLLRLPPVVLTIVAGVAASAAPLARDPGWSYSRVQHVDGRRARLRLALWTAFRDRQIERPVTMRWHNGLRVRMHLGNDLSYCLYVGGSFEPNEFAFLGDVLRPGMVFIDGGANDGLYSLFAARRVGPRGTVVAVEPSRREYNRLLANVRLNGLETVIAVQAALGATPGDATLAIAELGHEGQNTIGSGVSNPNVRTASHEHVRVRVQTLDELVADQRLARVDVVKLDVEGSEVHALEGARHVIERHRPLLLVEAEDERLQSQDSTKADLFGLIAQIGYRVYVFDEATGRPRPARTAEAFEGNMVAAPDDWRRPTLPHCRSG